MIDAQTRQRIISGLLENAQFNAERAYKPLRSEIRALGKEQYQWLYSHTPAKLLSLSLKHYPSPLPKRDMERILGFGAAMTIFLISPVILTDEKKNRVIRAGALANLIVSVFDAFVDDPSLNNQWLRPFSRTLKVLLKGKRAPLQISRAPQLKILLGLTRVYLKELKQLCSSPEELQLLFKYIGRMYEAELATLGTSSPPKQFGYP